MVPTAKGNLTNAVAWAEATYHPLGHSSTGLKLETKQISFSTKPRKFSGGFLLTKFKHPKYDRNF